METQPQANLNAIKIQNLISNSASLPIIQNYIISLQKNNPIQSRFKKKSKNK